LGLGIGAGIARLNLNQQPTEENMARFYGMDMDTLAATYKENVCPACGCCNTPTGRLGSMEHYSCRDCGMEYSRSLNARKALKSRQEPPRGVQEPLRGVQELRQGVLPGVTLPATSEGL
jgi:hypothetical protein